MSKKQDKVDNGIVAVKSKVRVHVAPPVADTMGMIFAGLRII